MKRLILLVFLFFTVVISAKSQGCTNINFEMGDFTNWVGKTGYCCPINLTSTGIVPDRHTIMTDVVGTDPWTGYQLKYVPPGYKYSARLGNSDTGAEAEGLSYTLTVDHTNALFIYKFAVVLEDPNHSPHEQPLFQISVRDRHGAVIDACTEYTVVAAASIPGFQSYYNVRWRDWTTVGLNLLPYLGQTVTIELMTGDCSRYGHFGYAYVVAECNPMELVAAYCTGSSIANFAAPDGFAKYEWSNGDTTQVVTVNSFSEGDSMSCKITSVTGCEATLSTKLKRTIVQPGFTHQNNCPEIQFTDTTYLNVGSVGAHLWDFGDGNTSTDKNPVHIYAASGTYDVKLIVTTFPASCVDSLTKQISLIVPSDLTANDIIICAGQKVTISASTSDNTASMSWYRDAARTSLITTAKSFETSILTSDAVFYVELLNAGCFTRDSVAVTVLPLPMLTTANISVCSGNTATVTTVNPDYFTTYRWYRDVNYSNLIVQSLSFNTTALSSDTTFYIEALSNNGCRVRDQVKVLALPNPKLTIPDVSICSGTNAALTATSTDINTTFVWYSDPYYSNLIAYSATLSTGSLTSTTTYYAEVTKNRCSTKKPSTVTVIQHPVVVAMPDKHACYGEDVNLEVIKYEGTISWDVGQTIVRPPNKTQNYIVTASRQPCPDVRDTVTITVGDELKINPTNAVLPPYYQGRHYSFQFSSNANLGHYTVIGGTTPNGINLNGDGSINGASNNDSNIEHDFTVQVEDTYGCKGTNGYKLFSDFFTPKVFTPNGDGINDYFMLGFEIIIYDRMGVKIFEGTNGWDGTYKGKQVSPDIYYYIVKYAKAGKQNVKPGYIGVEK